MKRGVKWVAYGLAFFLFLILGEQATPLTERAIAVGLGIDKEGEEYTVSAQILVPATGNDKAQNSAIATARSKTLSGALNHISKDTGLKVTLSHCNLVILGMGVMERDAFTTLDYLRRNAYLSENALLAGAKNAFEILDTDVAFSGLASFYAQRALISAGNYKDIARKTVKDFLNAYYTENGGNWLTLMEKTEIAGKETEGAEQGNKDPQYLFDLSKTAILKKGRYVFTTTEEETAGINYVLDKLDKGAIQIEGDSGEAIELYILKGEGKLEFAPDKLEVDVKIKVDLLLKEVVSPPSHPDTKDDITKNSLSPAETERIKKQIADNVEGVFRHAQAEGVDIFDCYGGFYRKGGRKWADGASKEYLSKTLCKTTVEVEYE